MADKKKYRMTNQRALVLQILRDADTHPTADEVFVRVKVKMPHISLGTVYRNLEFLCTQGLAKKIETSGVQRRYECTSDKHYHVRCIACGKIDDIEIGPESRQLHKGLDTEGYEIIGHQLEFTGYCPPCTKKKKRSASRKD